LVRIFFSPGSAGARQTAEQFAARIDPGAADYDLEPGAGAPNVTTIRIPDAEYRDLAKAIANSLVTSWRIETVPSRDPAQTDVVQVLLSPNARLRRIPGQ
jgi:hypothetical protein